MADAPAGRHRNEIGGFAVQRFADLHQFLEPLPRISGAEQRAMPRPSGAFGLLRHRGLEVHHPAALGEQAAIVRIQHCATAGGEHHAGLRGQRRNRLALALAESGLAFALENQRDVGPGVQLDFMIAVDEGQIEQTRDLPSDRGFARPHGADEEHVGAADHAAPSMPGMAPETKRPPEGGRRRKMQD